MKNTKNVNWAVLSDDGRSSISVQHAVLAVLMDLRDEFQALNRLLGSSPVLQTIAPRGETQKS